jgi:threonine dehydratase
MAAIEDYSRPTTPDSAPNGLASPRTPKQTGLALTEYTANPSPPSGSPKDRSSGVPESFLLPNGYPDVRPTSSTSSTSSTCSTSDIEYWRLWP